MGSRTRGFANSLGSIVNDRSISESNRNVILGYLRTKQSENLTESRLQRISIVMRHLAASYAPDLSKTSQEQFQDMVITINGNTKWADWTKCSTINVLKNFIKWLNKQYKLGIDTSGVRNQRPKNSVMPEYLITEDEFNRLMNTTDDLQTKLLLGLLYESGARIGELLTLKLQNITFNTYGARLALKGKTGQRIIPIVWYTNLLRQFIEIHPMKDNPEALLWYLDEGKGVLPLNYDSVRMRLIRLCAKAGIRKRIHPHLLGHTRMTELAERAGWQNPKGNSWLGRRQLRWLPPMCILPTRM